MKIFFPIENLAGVESFLDERFGRAPYILIYETEDDSVILAKENPFAHQDHGVGVSIANFIIQQECRIAVGTRFGPKAEDILKAAGIKMIEVDAANRETVKGLLTNLKTTSRS